MTEFRYRKNKWWSLALFVFLCIGSVNTVFPQSHSKNSKRDLENKKRRINDEIRQINSMLSETKANKKNSIGALVNINMKLEKRQELINTINAQIADLNREIKHNETQIDQLKAN